MLTLSALGKSSVLLGVVAAAAVAARAEITEVHWYHGGGGDMLSASCWDKGNWSWDEPGTVPTGSNDACFYGKGEKPVTLSGDLSIHRLRVGVTDGDLDLAIDLLSHTLTFVDNPEREWGDWDDGVDVNGDTDTGHAATLTIKNGTLANCCYLKSGGESGGRGAFSTLILDGARFEGGRGDIVVGNSSSNCTFEVLNGGYAEPKRSVVIGLENNDASPGCNTIHVSGEGSTIVAHSKGGDNTQLPSGGSYNKVIVENGGVFRNDLYFENPWWYQATYVGVKPGADHNEIIVRAGGRWEHPGEMRVGLSGSYNTFRVTGEGSTAAFSQSALTVGDTDDGHTEHPGVGNAVEVLDGAQVTFGAGSEIWAMIGRGSGSDGNTGLVSGAGSYFGILPSMLAGDGHPMRYVSVGDYGGCSNSLTVANGGTVAFDNIYVGGHVNSHHNMLNVIGEGSVLTNTNYDIFIGASDDEGKKGGAFNVLNVEDGGFVYAPRNVFVGMSGVESAVSNTLRIVNGIWEQPGNYDIKLKNGATLVWGGSKGRINTPWLHAFDDATLVFEFDEEGIAPFTTRWEMFLAKADGTLGVSKIKVDASRFVKEHGSGTFELMKATGGHSARRPDRSELSAEEYAHLNAEFAARVECIPSSCVVEADLQHGCRVTVRVPAVGFVVSIR